MRSKGCHVLRVAVKSTNFEAGNVMVDAAGIILLTASEELSTAIVTACSDSTVVRQPVGEHTGKDST